MTTYLYETIPGKADEPARQFEIKQSMKDAALTVHPETGEPVRRVVTGGFGLITSRPTSSPSPHRGSCSGGGCGCH